MGRKVRNDTKIDLIHTDTLLPVLPVADGRLGQEAPVLPLPPPLWRVLHHLRAGCRGC